MARTEIVIGGFGGQGIVLAGFILGQAAAIFDGKNATFAQDYGPEARGGACRAQVVISDGPISYPYIQAPSAVAVMSQEAYAKYGTGLGRNVPLLIDQELVKPRQSRSRRVFPIPATRIAGELGRTAVANIVMLGFLTAITGVISEESVKKSLLRSVPRGTEELNMKAFDRGYSCGLEQRAPGNRNG